MGHCRRRRTTSRPAEEKGRTRILSALTRLVKLGVLLFPGEVFDELDRRHDPESSKPDLPFKWARDNKEDATRVHTLQDVN